MDYKNKEIFYSFLSKDRNPREDEFYRNFILENMHDFDAHDWGLFINTSELIGDTLRQQKEFWLKVYQYLKDNAERMNFNTLMDTIRISVLIIICESAFEELSIKSDE